MKGDLHMKKKADMAVRIAKTVAITAGICSSDEEDDFDAGAFVDGFTGKMKKKVNEYMEGIHSGDAMMGSMRIPHVFFPEDYSGEFTAGCYVGKFGLSYSPDCEPDGFRFCIGASLLKDSNGKMETLWSDKSCYTMHVKSFSGERAVLKKSPNAFTISNVGDCSMTTILGGEAVIDEYGVDSVGKDSDKSDVAKANYEFVSDELKKMSEGIRKKITAWIDDNKVISSLCTDLSDEVNQSERARKEATDAMK